MTIDDESLAIISAKIAMSTWAVLTSLIAVTFNTGFKGSRYVFERFMRQHC